MQKSILALTILLFFHTAQAQYYYNDVINLKASNNLYLNLKRNNVQQISATSTESDGSPTTGFVYLKLLKNNASLVITHTELESAGASDNFDTYANDRLVKSYDSADNVLTTIDYTYDSQGNILFIQTRTDDTAMNVHSAELHKWFYTSNVPDSMMKIKDSTDTTMIYFKKDDRKNIAEELWMKKGRMTEHYFYYYNNAGQLTDIVRFNNKAQQLLPDFLLEYNTNGVITQLTQIPEGSSDYVVWQYTYDERGLKTQDVLFNKHQELLGTVTYTYK